MTTIWDSKDQELFLVISTKLSLDTEKQRQLLDLIKKAKLTIDDQFHPLCSENTTRSGLSNYDISNSRYQILMGLACCESDEVSAKYRAKYNLVN